MTVYRYGLRLRPPVPGAVPKHGLVSCKEMYGKGPSGHYIYGIADYKERLMVDEVVAYDLEYMGKVEVENDV